MKRRIAHFYAALLEIDFFPVFLLLFIVSIPLLPFFLAGWIWETLTEEIE